MARFDFDKFDLDVAKALGEVPEDTLAENHIPFRPERSDEAQVGIEAPDYMSRLYGVKKIGQIAIPGIKKP